MELKYRLVGNVALLILLNNVSVDCGTSSENGEDSTTESQTGIPETPTVMTVDTDMSTLPAIRTYHYYKYLYGS